MNRDWTPINIKVPDITKSIFLPTVKLKMNRINPNPIRNNPSILWIDDHFALLFNGTDKVLLESVIYGNAAYVVSSNWRELSRLTKTELKDNYKPVGKVKDFRHTGDWFSKLKNYLQTGFE